MLWFPHPLECGNDVMDKLWVLLLSGLKVGKEVFVYHCLSNCVLHIHSHSYYSACLTDHRLTRGSVIPLRREDDKILPALL